MKIVHPLMRSNRSFLIILMMSSIQVTQLDDTEHQIKLIDEQLVAENGNTIELDYQKDEQVNDSKTEVSIGDESDSNDEAEVEQVSQKNINLNFEDSDPAIKKSERVISDLKDENEEIETQSINEGKEQEIDVMNSTPEVNQGKSDTPQKDIEPEAHDKTERSSKPYPLVTLKPRPKVNILTTPRGKSKVGSITKTPESVKGGKGFTPQEEGSTLQENDATPQTKDFIPHGKRRTSQEKVTTPRWNYTFRPKGYIQPTKNTTEIPTTMRKSRNAERSSPITFKLKNSIRTPLSKRRSSTLSKPEADMDTKPHLTQNTQIESLNDKVVITTRKSSKARNVTTPRSSSIPRLFKKLSKETKKISKSSESIFSNMPSEPFDVVEAEGRNDKKTTTMTDDGNKSDEESNLKEGKKTETVIDFLDVNIQNDFDVGDGINRHTPSDNEQEESNEQIEKPEEFIQSVNSIELNMNGNPFESFDLSESLSRLESMKIEESIEKGLLNELDKMATKKPCNELVNPEESIKKAELNEIDKVGNPSESNDFSESRTIEDFAVIKESGNHGDLGELVTPSKYEDFCQFLTPGTHKDFGELITPGTHEDIVEIKESAIYEEFDEVITPGTHEDIVHAKESDKVDYSNEFNVLEINVNSKEHTDFEQTNESETVDDHNKFKEQLEPLPSEVSVESESVKGPTEKYEGEELGGQKKTSEFEKLLDALKLDEVVDSVQDFDLNNSNTTHEQEKSIAFDNNVKSMNVSNELDSCEAEDELSKSNLSDIISEFDEPLKEAEELGKVGEINDLNTSLEQEKSFNVIQVDQPIESKGLEEGKEQKDTSKPIMVQKQETYVDRHMQDSPETYQLRHPIETEELSKIELPKDDQNLLSSNELNNDQFQNSTDRKKDVITADVSDNTNACKTSKDIELSSPCDELETIDKEITQESEKNCELKLVRQVENMNVQGQSDKSEEINESKDNVDTKDLGSSEQTPKDSVKQPASNGKSAQPSPEDPKPPKDDGDSKKTPTSGNSSNIKTGYNGVFITIVLIMSVVGVIVTICYVVLK